jgi:hypothetical protein
MTRNRNARFRHHLAGLELKEPHAARNPSGSRASSLTAVLRTLIIALVLLAALPAAASAALVEIEITPEDGADYGETHAVTGKLTGLYGAPLVGRQLTLETRRYPFKQAFRPAGTATSGLDGRFAFERKFDRNHDVRVVLPESGDRSAFKRLYVFPATSLTFSLVKRNVIRIVQTYRTPKNIRLTAPTVFYVGRAGRPRAPVAARAKTKPVTRKVKGSKKPQRVKGRFRSSADVRIPAAWKGRFRYASCFPYNAGMGNPKLGCPKQRYRF